MLPPRWIAIAVVAMTAALANAQPAPASPEPPELPESPEPVVDEDPRAPLAVAATKVAEAEDAPLSVRRASPLALRSQSSHASLEIGMLLSMLADFGFTTPQSDDNGFSLADARVAFLGTLPSSFRYLLQVNFANDPTLLDMRLSYQPRSFLRVNVGLFKVPMSGEFLIPAADLDFIDRARVVNLISPKRSLGIEVSGAGPDRIVFYRAGVFNGEPGGANDGGLLGVARAGTEFDVGCARVTVAASVSYARDHALALSFLPAPFAGTRRLGGGDLRVTRGHAFVSAEALYGYFDSDTAAVIRGWGYHATAGYQLHPSIAARLRWDSMHAGDLGVASDLLIPSIALQVPGLALVQAQLDAVIPVDAADQVKIRTTFSIVY